jgi:hypothetical protein
MVLACAQEGHCHEVVVLEDAADIEEGEDRLAKKREVRASCLTMPYCCCCCC